MTTREEQIREAQRKKEEREKATANTLTEMLSRLSEVVAWQEKSKTSHDDTVKAVNELIVLMRDQIDKPATSSVELPEAVTQLPSALADLEKTLNDRMTKVETAVKQSTPASPSETTLSAETKLEIADLMNEALESRAARLRAKKEASGSKPQRSPVAGWPAFNDELREVQEAHDKLNRSLRWAGWGQLALAVVPFAVVVVVLLALVIPIAEILGVGPLAAWAWNSFEAAESVGTKSWIALATLAVISAVSYGAYRAGLTLARRYKEMTR